jgi:hypothetical protein
MPIVRAFFTAILFALVMTLGRAFLSLFRAGIARQAPPRQTPESNRRAAPRTGESADPRGKEPSREAGNEPSAAAATKVRREDIIDVSYEEVS